MRDSIASWHPAAMTSAVIALMPFFACSPAQPVQEPAPLVSTPSPTGEVELAETTPVLDCPADTTVAVHLRVIDAQKAPTSRDWTRYEKMRFAREHKNVPSEDFGLTADAAIERVIELERANPEIIPAGFREQLIANPRDAKLRLRVARCELLALETRRRASYDALMAHLLGLPLAEVEEVLIQSTKFGASDDRRVRSCPKSGCPRGEICDELRNRCMTPRAEFAYAIAEVESKVEDALGRALMPAFAAQPPRSMDRDSGLFWWGITRVHRCGKRQSLLCKFSDYSSKSGRLFVHWDLRDGGSVRTLRCEDMKGRAKRKRCLRNRKRINRCWKQTGTRNQEDCLWKGEHFRWKESALSKCYTSCATRSELRSP